MKPEARLAEIRERIVQSRKKRLLQGIAMELLESGGDLATVHAAFAARWVDPTPDELDAAVATKVQASLAHSEIQLQQALDADRLSKEKVAKFEALLEQVRVDAGDTASVASAEAELSEFQALAELVGTSPASAPGTVHKARAGVARGSRSEG